MLPGNTTSFNHPHPMPVTILALWDSHNCSCSSTYKKEHNVDFVELIILVAPWMKQDQLYTATPFPPWWVCHNRTSDFCFTIQLSSDQVCTDYRWIMNGIYIPSPHLEPSNISVLKGVDVTVWSNSVSMTLRVYTYVKTWYRLRMLHWRILPLES